MLSWYKNITMLTFSVSICIVYIYKKQAYVCINTCYKNEYHSQNCIQNPTLKKIIEACHSSI